MMILSQFLAVHATRAHRWAFGLAPGWAFGLALATLVSLPAAADARCPLPGVSKELLADRETARFCPRRLKDSKTIARYVDAFPKSKYRVKRMPDGTRFYLDSIKDTIKDFLRRGIPWEQHNTKLLRKYIKPGTTAVDIGAHIGTHTLSMAKFVGANGRVVAFEPQRKIFRELAQNIRLNRLKNVAALRYALGSGAGVVTMSASTPKNEGATGIGAGGDKVELRTLDSFALKNISVLKIDVEGHENGVLDGAKKTIAREKPILLVEVLGGQNIIKAVVPNKRKIFATIDKMVALGYRVKRVSYHDFLGEYVGNKSSVRPGFVRVIQGNSPRLLTSIGRKRGRAIVGGRRKGMLVFGPYDYLPPGNYVVRWKGTVRWPGVVAVDVVSAGGNKLHGTRRFKVGAKRGSIASLAFSLVAEATDLEYRLWIDGKVRASVNQVDIIKLAP
jgi:FkbM family methyltransferase